MVWLFGETLTVEYATELLAQYQVAQGSDPRQFRDVSDPRLFATQYRSPQPFLATLEDVPW